MPFNKHIRTTALFPLVASLALLFLAGCQSTPLYLDAFETEMGPASSTYGEGDVPIGVIVPEGSQGIGQAYLDGIKLGADLLGEGAFRLVIQRTNGTEQSAKSTLADFLAFRTKFILGPTDAADLAALPPDLPIPILAFMAAASANTASTGQEIAGQSGGVFTFLSDPIDGLNEAIRATIEAGRLEILLLSSDATPGRHRNRAENYITSRGGTLSGSFSFSGEGGKTFASIKRRQSQIKSADVVALLGSDAEVKALLDVFAAHGLREGGGVTLISASNDAALNKADPVYEGVVYAALPSPDLALIEEAFELKYGRSPSLEATYGFDAMAMLAGLYRTGQLTHQGADQPAPQAGSRAADVLKNPSGFKALNGHFRFRADGSVERRHEVYQVKSGEAILLQEIGDGF